MSIDSMERQGPEIEAKARLVKLEAKVNAYVRLAERILQQNPEDENAKFIQGRIKRMQTRFKEIDAEKTLGNRDQVKADFASHNVLKLFTDSEVHGGSMLSVVDRIKNTYGVEFLSEIDGFDLNAELEGYVQEHPEDTVTRQIMHPDEDLGVDREANEEILRETLDVASKEAK